MDPPNGPLRKMILSLLERERDNRRGGHCFKKFKFTFLVQLSYFYPHYRRFNTFFETFEPFLNYFLYHNSKYRLFAYIAMILATYVVLFHRNASSLMSRNLCLISHLNLLKNATQRTPAISIIDNSALIMVSIPNNTWRTYKKPNYMKADTQKTKNNNIIK